MYKVYVYMFATLDIYIDIYIYIYDIYTYVQGLRV